MSRRIDAATLLERALLADAATAGVVIAIGTAQAIRWASATFVGATHRLTIAGDGIGSWLDQLAEADLPLRGHLVADVAVIDRLSADGHITATVEILTVEAA